MICEKRVLSLRTMFNDIGAWYESLELLNL